MVFSSVLILVALIVIGAMSFWKLRSSILHSVMIKMQMMTSNVREEETPEYAAMNMTMRQAKILFISHSFLAAWFIWTRSEVIVASSMFLIILCIEIAALTGFGWSCFLSRHFYPSPAMDHELVSKRGWLVFSCVTTALCIALLISIACTFETHQPV